MSKMLESIKKIVKEYKFQILLIVLISIAICLFDQLTKWLAVYFLGPLEEIASSEKLPTQIGNSVEIIPGFLSFTLLTNNGAAFGLGSGTMIARVLFIIISWLVFLGVPVFLIFYYKKYNHKISIINLISLILIYGGNLGNLIDRTFYWTNPCGVIDFIDISDLIPGFGVFNIADSAVVLGVVVLIISLIIDIFKGDDKDNKEKEELKEIKKENANNSSNLVENDSIASRTNDDGKEVSNK